MWGNNIVGKGCFARPSWGPAPTPDRRRHRMRQQQRYNIAVPAHRSESAESLRRSPAPTFSEARGRSKLEVRPETAGYEASTFNGTLSRRCRSSFSMLTLIAGLRDHNRSRARPGFLARQYITEPRTPSAPSPFRSNSERLLRKQRGVVRILHSGPHVSSSPASLNLYMSFIYLGS